jgi:CheY-like chemotaxis protein
LLSIRPQVIFVDLLMPNIDGVALCRLLRRSPIHRQAYLVVISAVAAEAPELVKQCRANAALAKGPFRVLGPAAVRLVNEAAGHGFRGVREGIAGLEDIHPPDPRELPAAPGDGHRACRRASWRSPPPGGRLRQRPSPATGPGREASWPPARAVLSPTAGQ